MILHYAGDLTAEAEGQVIGPTLVGEYLCVAKAVYDYTTDRTVVICRYATATEVIAHQGAGP